MSTRISSAGEFSSHTPDEEFFCRDCGAFCEDDVRSAIAKVRRETLTEAEALIRPSIRIESTEDHFDVVTANTALHRAADRIARAAEAVDPRGE